MGQLDQFAKETFAQETATVTLIPFLIPRSTRSSAG
jgi:hypothetical protein